MPNQKTCMNCALQGKCQLWAMAKKSIENPCGYKITFTGLRKLVYLPSPTKDDSRTITCPSWAKQDIKSFEIQTREE